MKSNIKALLLAAGYGTRLRPITFTTPKCLVDIDGEPLLAKWIKKLSDINCNEVLINTHYLAEKVSKFIELQHDSLMQIREIYEPCLQGTAGTLRNNAKFFENSTGILIHADNIMEEELNNLLEAHKNRPNGCVLTMLTFESKNPTQCGIVEIDSIGIVKNFHEKVSNPPGNLANGAIYVFDYDFIDFLNNLNIKLFDFSNEVLPKLIGKIYTYHTSGYFIDIGTIENLNYAKKIFSNP